MNRLALLCLLLAGCSNDEARSPSLIEAETALYGEHHIVGMSDEDFIRLLNEIVARSRGRNGNNGRVPAALTEKDFTP
jgi:hypothetical protein